MSEQGSNLSHEGRRSDPLADAAANANLKSEAYECAASDHLKFGAEQADGNKQSLLHPLLIQARAACRVYRDSERRVTQILAPVYLSAAGCLVLEALARRGEAGATVAEVATFIGIHRTSAGATVEQMAALGLVEKRTDKSDARKMGIHLTTLGRARLLGARALLQQSSNSVMLARAETSR